MSGFRSALLSDRGVVAVTGPDARKILQGVITNDMDRLEGAGRSLHSGLLSPQGKILFDFFVVARPDGYLLETDAVSVAGLAKRLSMYKLRADAEVTDVSNIYTVSVFWGESPENLVGGIDCVAFPDPRLAELGGRLLVASPPSATVEVAEAEVQEAAYHARRVALGVPEAGRDFELGDTFPHEALYDQLDGVSFTKGCYVGQEVVSRMQHRGTARKRIVPLIADADLPGSGAPVTAGTASLGSLGTVAGSRALALLRLDRAAEALHKGEAIEAGGVPVRIEIPPWASFRLEVRDRSA